MHMPRPPCDHFPRKLLLMVTLGPSGISTLISLVSQMKIRARGPALPDLLKPQRASGPSGELLISLLVGPTPEVPNQLGWTDVQSGISNKTPGDAAAADLGKTPQELLLSSLSTQRQ